MFFKDCDLSYEKVLSMRSVLCEVTLDKVMRKDGVEIVAVENDEPPWTDKARSLFSKPVLDCQYMMILKLDKISLYIYDITPCTIVTFCPAPWNWQR